MCCSVVGVDLADNIVLGVCYETNCCPWCWKFCDLLLVIGPYFWFLLAWMLVNTWDGMRFLAGGLPDDWCGYGFASGDVSASMSV